ncbi:MAG: hypothetical protein P1V36_05840 [Planctomycetota bacterium]|nr:hypothetical protein [Planctomycetota bacterium]
MIPAGTYRLRLSGSWHQTIEREVTIVPGRLTPVRLLVRAKD